MKKVAQLVVLLKQNFFYIDEESCRASGFFKTKLSYIDEESCRASAFVKNKTFLY